jgi:hypothetical protein
MALQPANSIKAFMVFLSSRANAELVSKFQVAHAALPIVSSKFRPNAAFPMLNQNFTIMRPFQRHIKINSNRTQ